MRISEQWLREWVDPPVNSNELAEQLTMAGLEVDAIDRFGDEFDQVVVGRIVELNPHPNADKLRVATVDIGQHDPLQIVCGAPNAAVGLCAPTAPVGATLPGGLKIKASCLRDVESQGMLCSAKELELSDDASGLLALPADSEPGTDLKTLLRLPDTVIEVDLTPNRGDCLGMVGIAREVSVRNRCAMTPVDIHPVAASIDDTFPVALDDPEGCPRFVGRVIKNLNPKATTPLWLVERLRRAGLRSLGPLVDVTNYIMLELNHPMHAYDLNRLTDGIRVRCSQRGESVELLNGQTIELDDDTLLITDGSGPIGLAGIMGGASTEIDDDTVDVFLECAFFKPTRIAGRARRFALHTDASHRFERGVDPQAQVVAVERATELLLAMAGGEAGPTIDTHVASQLPQPPTIRLRTERTRLLLGIDVPTAEIEDILHRLGMDLESCDGGWWVTPPHRRFDLTMEADLIEEIIRIWGYERIPSARPATHLPLARCPEGEVAPARFRQTLIQRGYQEAISYSFVDAELQRLIDPEQAMIPLSNPISTEMAVMRTSLWPGLLKTLQYNLARQQTRARLFEIGLNFRGSLDQLVQQAHVGGLISGNAFSEHWDTTTREADFYDIKGDVDALLALTGDTEIIRYQSAEHPALHPGQSARIMRGDSTVGWLGALHPRLQRQLDLDQRVFLFELNIDTLQSARIPAFSELSKFPQSRRDLAVVVADSIPAQKLIDAINDLGGERLQAVTLFDIYRGKSIEKNQKSLAFGLIFQDFSSSLTDQAIEDLWNHIVAGLKQQFGAKLR